MYVLPFTSYEKDNNPDLGNALYGLYVSISFNRTPQSTNRLRAFNEKEHDIYICVCII
jgi:hypothetical protein